MTECMPSNHTCIIKLTTVSRVDNQFIKIGFDLPNLGGSVHHN